MVSRTPHGGLGLVGLAALGGEPVIAAAGVVGRGRVDAPQLLHQPVGQQPGDGEVQGAPGPAGPRGGGRGEWDLV
jgi:hypothetical protein